MKEPDKRTITRGIDLLRRGMGLALLLVVLAGCGLPEGRATPSPMPPARIPSATAAIPPTATPAQTRATPTLVPLVTRTPVPTLTTAPTRVPELVRCTTFQPAGTEGPIWDIEIAPDGTVWIVAFGGVARLHPARKAWIEVAVGEDPGIDKFRSITAGPGDSVWLATRFGEGVYHWDGVSWTQLTSKDGLLSDWVNEVSLGPDGAVWFATKQGVSRWDEVQDAWTHYSGAGWLHDDEVHRVLFTPDGTIWFAHNDALTRWRPSDADDESDRWEVAGLEAPLAVRKALVSADGRLWLGQIVYDPSTEEWSDTVYRQIHVQGLAVDSEGGLWIARGDGALYIPEPESSPPGDWLHVGRAQGVGADSVTAIALERDDLVWFGTEQGVTRCFIEGLR